VNSEACCPPSGWCPPGLQAAKSPTGLGWGFYVYAGDHLISHTLTRAVPSAQRGLTSVFGMGTGVTLVVNSPANWGALRASEPAAEVLSAFAEDLSSTIFISKKSRSRDFSVLNRLGLDVLLQTSWDNYRACVECTSNSGLTLRRVNSMDKPNGRLVLVSYTHYCASTSSLSTWWSSRALHFPFGLGDLILERASRLYAFSGYHNRTSLPSRALDRTTGTQEVRPSRSSRTKDSPLQISYAHSR